MARIQRTAKGGSSSQVIAEGSGIDPTGKTDSTTGLLNSYQKAINKNKDWYLPGGTYIIGEGGKGFDISTLEYPVAQTATAQVFPPKILCATTALLRGHPNLKANPVVAVFPPNSKNFGQFTGPNFQFGRITGPSVHSSGEFKAASKIVKGIYTTGFLEFFVGQPIETVVSGMVEAGTKVAKVISSEEIELSLEAKKSESSAFRLGPSYEGAALYVGPGVVDGFIFVETVEEALYGCLCESKTSAEVLGAGWVANNWIQLQFAVSCANALYLKSPVKSTSFGTQGNRFVLGEVNGGSGPSAGKWGIVIDEAVGQNSTFNKFDFSVIEATTEGGILDRNGATDVEGNYLGVINPAAKKNYVFASGAEGVPFVRASMAEGYTIEGTREGVDLINRKEKVGIGSGIASPPTKAGVSARNTAGRPVSGAVLLTPKAFGTTAAMKLGEKEWKLTEAEQKGYILPKAITFTKLDASITSFKIEVPYYIVKTSGTGFELAKEIGGAAMALEGTPGIFTLTGNTAVKAKVFNLTGAKEKGFTNGTKVQFTEVTAGVTNPKTFTTYFVVKEEANAFEVATTEGGVGIEVEGAEVVAASTKIGGFAEQPLGIANVGFTTPNLRWQLTGNSPIGTTLFALKGGRAKGFTDGEGKEAPYPRLARFTRLTTGVTTPGVGGTNTYFIVNSVSPSAETAVGETKINLKETSGVAAENRFPNNTVILFSETPVGVTTPKKNTNYFVVGASKEGFEFSLTEGGAALKVEGAALTTTGTRINRPNNFELSQTSETGTPIKIAGAELKAATTEINPALVSVEQKWLGAEGEGFILVPVPVNGRLSFGIYNSEAVLTSSLGT